MAIATDGEAIVLHPLPDGFTESHTVSREWPGAISAGDGAPSQDSYDLSALEHPPVYRIALTAAKLAHLAEAMENEVVILEFPADPEGKPIKVLPWSGAKTGYLMPQAMPPGEREGILVEVGPAGNVSEIQTSKRDKPAAESKPLPPPVVTASAERHTLEIAFGGVPAKEIREALKDPALAFRYSGRGTRRGVPPNVWYGPDNPYTRQQIAALLPVPVKAAA